MKIPTSPETLVPQKDDPLAHLPIVLRNSVQTWECDRMGHFNVQFYKARVCQSVRTLLRLFGGVEDATPLRFKTAHMRFLAEQLPGAPYYCLAGLIAPHAPDQAPDAGALTQRFYVEMRESMTDRPAATATLDVELPKGFDLAKLAPFFCALPPHGLPRGLPDNLPRPRPCLADTEGRPMFRTYILEVPPERCDAQGAYKPESFMATISDSISNLFAQTRDAMISSEDENMGGAALEYRFNYHAFPKAGDIICVHSGLSDLQEKTYSWVHWVFDAVTGDAVATAAAVAIAMDLRARKAIVIPDDTRAKLGKILDTSLSV